MIFGSFHWLDCSHVTKKSATGLFVYTLLFIITRLPLTVIACQVAGASRAEIKAGAGAGAGHGIDHGYRGRMW